jgi:hypothetical protein
MNFELKYPYDLDIFLLIANCSLLIDLNLMLQKAVEDAGEFLRTVFELK